MEDSKMEKEIEELQILKNRHKGEWITREVVNLYQQKVNALGYISGEDVGEKRKLRIELQGKYGLTELEALNILNGNHVSDILERYRRIQNLIPLNIKKSSTSKKAGEEEA